MASHDQDHVIAGQVRADRLQQLFRQSFPAVLGSLLGAMMLCWLCWDRIEYEVMLAWLGLLSAATVLRLAVFAGYLRSPASQRTPQRWEPRYWGTLVLSAGIWGGGALAMMPAGDLLTQALVMLFTVGMSVGAVASYSAYRSMTLAAIALVLLPCSIWLLAQPSKLQFGTALAALLFAAVVVLSSYKLSDALERAFRLSREMERAHSLSILAAQTDELTGLNNRRAFFEQAQQAYQHCQGHQLPVCVLMLDIDHFKQINDTYGHHIGDLVLERIGAVIRRHFREADVSGRVGGEEFAVLLPDTTLRVATDIGQRFVEAIAGLNAEPAHLITASLGVASAQVGHADLQYLLNSADQALYQAKALGRNQVAVAG